MDRYLIFGIVIIMMILLLLHMSGSYFDTTEKFADTEIPNLQACPASLTQYTTDKSINCCDGTANSGNKCDGTPKCTLSNSSNALPRCIDWYRDYLSKMSNKYCPPSMKQFYEASNEGRKDNKVIGLCTASALSRDMKKPLDDTAAKCEVYKTPSENERMPQSCYNLRRLEKMITPPDSKKQVVSMFGTNYPVVLFATYFDELKNMNCADRGSFHEFVDATFGSNWRSDAGLQQLIKQNFVFCDDEKKRIEARRNDPFYKSPLEKLNIKLPKRSA